MPKFKTIKNVTSGAMAFLISAGMASTTFGQTQAGSSGHALDANQQVGANGINAAAEQIDFRARNNIVTGNVTDFRAFRGDVGYSAVGDFQGDLGSDDLFRYRADSFSSGRTQLNSVNINRGGVNSSNSVYSTVSEVPSYHFNQSTLNTQRFAPSGGGFTVFSPVGQPSSALGVITETPTVSIREAGSTLGVIAVPDGRTLQVNASPLLGLQRSELPSFIRPEDVQDRFLQPDEAQRFEAQQRDELEIGSAARLDTQLNNIEAQNDLTLGPVPLAAGQVQPTLLLGQAIESRMTLDRADVPARETLDQRVERINDSIFRPLGNRQVEPGEDVYLDLLMQMQGSQNSSRTEAQPMREGNESIEVIPSGTSEDDASELDTLRPASPSIREALIMPTVEQLDEAENDLALVRRADTDGDGLQSMSVDAFMEQLRDEARSGQGTEDESETEALAQLLEALSQDTTPVGTLAGDKETRLNTLMRQAERELAAGRYFAAESIYRQIVTNAGDQQPLARVGLVHSQLAAGMIRSAGQNMRELFAKHPELIGVRYESNLLPPRERLTWLQQELQRAIDRDSKSGEPGLLLAYLGYQADSSRLMRYGLTVAQSHAPRDTLLPIVRQIWLSRTDSQK